MLANERSAVARIGIGPRDVRVIGHAYKRNAPIMIALPRNGNSKYNGMIDSKGIGASVRGIPWEVEM
jgi:hypothetical protein